MNIIIYEDILVGTETNLQFNHTSYPRQLCKPPPLMGEQLYRCTCIQTAKTFQVKSLQLKQAPVNDHIS